MRFTKTTLCVTCVAPSGMKLQWRMTLFTPEFTTWVGLPTHKHDILPFTSAHWLTTQLEFKTISGHWVQIQSINETAVIGAQWCHYLLSSNRFLSVNTSREMTHQVGLCYKQTSWLQWNQAWREKSRFVCVFTSNVSSKMEWDGIHDTSGSQNVSC